MVNKLTDFEQAVANAKTAQDMRDAMKILKERRRLFMEKSKVITHLNLSKKTVTKVAHQK